MMRPMMLEFPDDTACEMLDRQYMLGERLLVAPIFREDGRVDYYLPDGTWTNLLTDEKAEGGHWRREVHDFMTLPLMVRPGTVLPIGARDDQPDYDYADGLELHVFALPEGATQAVRIWNAASQPVATYTVSMRDGRVIVETDSKKTYSVIVH